jgi:hypothetical protein
MLLLFKDRHLHSVHILSSKNTLQTGSSVCTRRPGSTAVKDCPTKFNLPGSKLTCGPRRHSYGNGLMFSLTAQGCWVVLIFRTAGVILYQPNHRSGENLQGLTYKDPGPQVLS